MDAEKIEAFRQRLHSMKAELRALEQESREAMQPVELDQTSVGRLSRVDAMQGQQLALEVARRRQLRLLAIEGALRRIEVGEFGRCAACGEDIGVERLAVDPAVTRCVRCAEA
jgi:DnaK suppressor protein